ncbi:hypothetical protein CRUP_029906 [Coryphaenoides rupestris]|nr:hypothetical protein CRUP_029906 [Coryphaenoides rupestris]
MEQPDHVDNLEAIPPASDVQVPQAPPSGHQDMSPIDILRIKEQMYNQCLEMSAQLNAAKGTRSCSPSEAEANLAVYVSELEEAKTTTFNKTLPLQRMQMWHAIAEKLKQNDPESDAVKALSDRCMALCSQIKQIQQESREIEDQVTDTQKQCLELKRLTHEKMKAIDKLMYQEHPDLDKYKAALQKGQSNLEKYKAMIVMTQNVLRGILLASKVNWLNDPKIKDIAMTLEDLPISD